MPEHYKRITLWILFGIFASVGFLRTEQAINAVDKEAKERSYSICTESNRVVGILRTLVQQQGQISEPPGASEELKIVLEQARKRGIEFRKFALKETEPLPCRELTEK